MITFEMIADWVAEKWPDYVMVYRSDTNYYPNGGGWISLHPKLRNSPMFIFVGPDRADIDVSTEKDILPDVVHIAQFEHFPINC